MAFTRRRMRFFIDLISTSSMHGKTDYINHFLLSHDIDISRFMLSRLIPVLSIRQNSSILQE